MGDVSNGRVYWGFDYDWNDADSDEERHPFWYGHCDFGEPEIEDGPNFRDANEAVQWWQEGGAKRILINLDGTEYLWAGTGTPPENARTGSAPPSAPTGGRRPWRSISSRDWP
jgi:hypothetical protein